jgi:hypothetical protein
MVTVFRGTGQVGLTQTTQFPLVSGCLESLGEDFRVSVPPGSFLFLTGKFGNGLVTRKKLTFSVNFLLLWSHRVGRDEAHANAANSEDESQATAGVGLAQGKIAKFCLDGVLFQNEGSLR